MRITAILLFVLISLVGCRSQDEDVAQATIAASVQQTVLAQSQAQSTIDASVQLTVDAWPASVPTMTLTAQSASLQATVDTSVRQTVDAHTGTSTQLADTATEAAQTETGVEPNLLGQVDEDQEGSAAHNDNNVVRLTTDRSAYDIESPSPAITLEASTALGLEWTIYTTSDGLVDNDVRDIQLAPDGSLWFATPRGASRLNREGVWQTFAVQDGLPNAAVNVITLAPDESLWFGTMSGIARLGRDGRWDIPPVRDEHPWLTQLPSRPLGVVNVTTGEVISTPPIIKPGQVFGLAVFPEDEVWFVTKGVTYYDQQARPYGYVNALIPNHDSLWIATSQGAVLYHSNGRRIAYSAVDGLASDHVQTVAVAPDGKTTWFGTSRGATKLDSQRNWRTYTTRDGLVSQSVSAIVVADDSSVWFGTDKGVSRLHPEGYFTTHNMKTDDLAGDVIRDIVISSDGALWFATDQGVSRLKISR